MTGIVVKPVEGTFLNLPSIMLYNSNDVRNHRLDCHLYVNDAQWSFRSMSLLPIRHVWSTLSVKRHCNPFYLCLLGAGAAGVEGFFKGIGKGLLGLLVHPTGGVIDMVSFTLDGVRRLKPFIFQFFITQVRYLLTLDQPSSDQPTYRSTDRIKTDRLTEWRTDSLTDWRVDRGKNRNTALRISIIISRFLPYFP